MSPAPFEDEPGHLLNITRQRVRQLEARALVKLSRRMPPEVKA